MDTMLTDLLTSTRDRLQTLRQEHQEALGTVDLVLAALTDIPLNGTPQRPLNGVGSRARSGGQGRPRMSTAARKAVSRRMRLWWKQQKAKTNRTSAR